MEEESELYGVMKMSVDSRGEPVNYLNTLNFWKKVEAACRERKVRWKQLDQISDGPRMSFEKVTVQELDGEQHEYGEDIGAIETEEAEISNVDHDAFENLDFFHHDKDPVKIRRGKSGKFKRKRILSILKKVCFATLLTSLIMAAAFYLFWKTMYVIPAAATVAVSDFAENSPPESSPCDICDQPTILNDFVNIIFPASNALDEV